MIVPSIDLQGGQTVQLIGGVEKALEAGDPRPIARRFGRVGEVAVIDLDAAIGTGSQTELVRELLDLAPCRVGGGIRDVETARMWLDAGAHKIILGTAARPEVLRELPRERVIVALDALSGEVVVEGWRTRTGRSIEECLEELREFADAFLITFVEREGRLGGIDLDYAARLVELAKGSHITFAGGITTAEEIAALDQLGADAQIGMALYRGHLDLTEGFAGVLRSDRADGLWPTVVQEEDGTLLGLCYSSLRSLREAIDSGRGVYESRRRGLWIKGESSGATQELLGVDVDCDRDTLRFLVRQHGDGFCHRGTVSCFADGPGLPVLMRRLAQRVEDAVPGSYTRRLLDDADLLRAKLCEEAGELADAEGREDVAAEAADLIYFASVALTRSGVSLAEVFAQLERRSRRVSRRPGNAKPGVSSP
jgi:phosphoribosyl-ATP pyrophosphohydrolase/phosphoribosyl-AMP cyclohydrolase